MSAAAAARERLDEAINEYTLGRGTRDAIYDVVDDLVRAASSELQKRGVELMEQCNQLVAEAGAREEAWREEVRVEEAKRGDIASRMRDGFACAAMGGFLARPGAGFGTTDCARESYAMADAMLAERAKGGA